MGFPTFRRTECCGWRDCPARTDLLLRQENLSRVAKILFPVFSAHAMPSTVVTPSSGRSHFQPSSLRLGEPVLLNVGWLLLLVGHTVLGWENNAVKDIVTFADCDGYWNFAT